MSRRLKLHTQTQSPPQSFLGRTRYATYTHMVCGLATQIQSVLSAVLGIMNDIYTHMRTHTHTQTRSLQPLTLACVFSRGNNGSHSLITCWKCFSTYSCNQMNLFDLFESCFILAQPAESPRSCRDSV